MCEDNTEGEYQNLLMDLGFREHGSNEHEKIFTWGSWDGIWPLKYVVYEWQSIELVSKNFYVFGQELAYMPDEKELLTLMRKLRHFNE